MWDANEHEARRSGVHMLDKLCHAFFVDQKCTLFPASAIPLPQTRTRKMRLFKEENRYRFTCALEQKNCGRSQSETNNIYESKKAFSKSTSQRMLRTHPHISRTSSAVLQPRLGFARHKFRVPTSRSRGDIQDSWGQRRPYRIGTLLQGKRTKHKRKRIFDCRTEPAEKHAIQNEKSVSTPTPCMSRLYLDLWQYFATRGTYIYDLFPCTH